MIKEFCKDLHAWLLEHPQNVAAIHCKAGKGRTGTLIACYLLYYRHSPDAESALNFFAVQRTQNQKGVTIPSQIRYVHYFDKYCRIKRRGGVGPGPTTLWLQSVFFRGIPSMCKSASSDLFFTIDQKNHPAYKEKEHKYKSKPQLAPIYHRRLNMIQFDCSKKLIPLNDDVLFTFFIGTTLGAKVMFQFWINTRYAECTQTGTVHVKDDAGDNKGTDPVLSLKKKELDKACKDKKNKRYPSDFRVELVFARTTIATEIKPRELKQAEMLVGASPVSSTGHHSTTSTGASAAVAATMAAAAAAARPH